MFKQLLVIVIIFLFMGGNVVPSIGHAIENKYFYGHSLKSNNSVKELISSTDTAFGYIAYSGDSGHPEGPCYFYLDNPSEIISLAPTESSDFLTGGTWTCDNRWFGFEYNTGNLWEIDPNSGDMEIIGDGFCFDISYNPVDGKLYSLCLSTIYCEGEVVFILSGNPQYLIGIAFDESGTLYGWDDYKLWIIDFEIGEAFLIGFLNINLGYGGYGHFDFDTDVLYITTYNSSGKLYECNEDTGECNLIGEFDGGAEITCLAIPGACIDSPPFTKISFDPPEPDGCNGWYVTNVTITLTATDDITGVNVTYYRINGGDWELYESPFILYEDGEDIFIDYYSVDYNGNIEDVKSEEIKIDKIPPNATVEWDTEKVDGKWYVTFTVNATDETSGLDDTIEMYINDGLWATVEGPGPEYVFEIEWSKQFKTAIIGFKICDRACNCILLKVNGSDIKAFNSIQEKSIYLLQYYLFTRSSLIQEILGFFKCQKNLLH